MRTVSLRRIARTFPLAIVLGAVTLTGSAQERDRSKIPDKYKWNLAEVYPSDAAWRAEKDRIAGVVPTLKEFKGKLASSASVLADALEKSSSVDKTLSRLYAYASMLSDQDTRDAARHGMQQEMIQLYTRFGAEAS